MGSESHEFSVGAYYRTLEVSFFFSFLSWQAEDSQSLITGALVKTGSNKWLACHG